MMVMILICMAAAVALLAWHIRAVKQCTLSCGPRSAVWLSLAVYLMFVGIVVLPEVLSPTWPHRIGNALVLLLAAVAVANGHREADLHRLRIRALRIRG